MSTLSTHVVPPRPGFEEKSSLQVPSKAPFRPRDDADKAARQLRGGGIDGIDVPKVLVILPNGRLPETGGERNMSFFAYGLHKLGVPTAAMVDKSPLADRLSADGISVYSPPPVQVSEQEAGLFHAEAAALGQLEQAAQVSLNRGEAIDGADFAQRVQAHIRRLDQLTLAPRKPVCTIVVDNPKQPLGWAHRALQIKRALEHTQSQLCLTDSQRDSIPAGLLLAGDARCRNVWYTQMTTATPADAVIAHLSHVVTCGHGVLASRFERSWWATAVPNGVDTQRFNRSRASQIRPTDMPVASLSIGHAAYFTPRKNQLALVQACGEKRAQLGDFRLFFFGETHYHPDKDSVSYFERVHQQAVTLQIDDRVHFLQSKSNIETYLPHLDVFVLPSTEEGLSLALLEAMSCGLPTLASDIAGNREMRGQGVTLFDPEDSSSLGEHLVQLAQDPAQRRQMGHAAAAHIRTAGYSTSGMISNMANALRSQPPSL